MYKLGDTIVLLQKEIFHFPLTTFYFSLNKIRSRASVIRILENFKNKSQGSKKPGFISRVSRGILNEFTVIFLIVPRAYMSIIVLQITLKFAIGVSKKEIFFFAFLQVFSNEKFFSSNQAAKIFSRHVHHN